VVWGKKKGETSVNNRFHGGSYWTKATADLFLYKYRDMWDQGPAQTEAFFKETASFVPAICGHFVDKDVTSFLVILKKKKNSATKYQDSLSQR